MFLRNQRNKNNFEEIFGFWNSEIIYCKSWTWHSNLTHRQLIIGKNNKRNFSRSKTLIKLLGLMFKHAPSPCVSAGTLASWTSAHKSYRHVEVGRRVCGCRWYASSGHQLAEMTSHNCHTCEPWGLCWWPVCAPACEPSGCFHSWMFSGRCCMNSKLAPASLLELHFFVALLNEAKCAFPNFLSHWTFLGSEGKGILFSCCFPFSLGHCHHCSPNR